MKDKDFVMLS